MKKIYTLLAIACASFLMVFAMPSESYAANDCYDGGGHFYTYGSGPYTSFASLGGSTYGVNWACEGGNGYAVLFMLGSSPWSDGTNYYFPADSYVDLGNSTYPMVLFGLVHGYWGGGDHYAASIGLCLTSSCSEGDNGNGVFSYSGTRVLRATSNADSNLSNWSAPITGGGLSVTINGPLLAQWIRDNPGATSQYAGNIWQVTIYNHRCWYDTAGGWGSCGTSPMTLLYDKDSGGSTTFDGSITAKIGGVTYANGSTYTSTTKSVTINYEDKVWRQDGESYNVYVCMNGSERFRYSNDCHNFTYGYEEHSRSGAIRIGTPPGTNITVCHSLSASPSKWENGSTSGSISKRHCMTITRDREEDKDDCSVMGSSYYMGSYSARSGAQMIFKKNSSSQTLEGTTSHTYWAKPGDDIQYEYRMCGGSEYSRNYSHDEPAINFTVSPSWTISGKKNSANNNNYVFGLSPTSYTSANVNYYLSKTSPSNDNYACGYNNGWTHSSNFYQIPAEAGRSTTCKSSSPTGPSDVGSSFSQSITYRSITTDSYSVYHPCWDEDGDCSWYTYGTKQVSNSEETLTGTVNVPYNYGLIGMTTHGLTKGVIYAGSDFLTTNKIKVLKRENKQVNGSTPYATRTKNTTIKVVSFTTSSSPSQNAAVVDAASASTKEDICAKAANGAHNYDNCTERVSSTEVLNDGNGQLNGDAIKTITASYTVPTNVTPGTRVCTAVAYWPVDSHATASSGSPNNYNTRIDSNNQSAALSSTGSHWAVSAPACVTVAKKPTFSVESSQAVTSGDVKTSMTTVGGRNYGSWSEYGIIAGGSVNNMASGAALGYQSHIFSTNLYSNINVGSPLANSGAPEAKTGCYISPQTMLNNNCSNIGGATRIISNYKGNEVAKKLADMYLMSDSKMASYSNESGMKGINSRTISINGKSPTINVGGKTYYNYYDLGDSACRYDTSTGKYYAPPYRSGNPYVRDNAGYHSPVFCTENGVKYYKVSGDVWMHGSGISANMQVGGAGTSDLGAGGSSSSYRNVTYVFDFRGTAIIDENMIINNAGYGDNFSTLDQLPTILIFADDVIITDNVKRLDAWIILGAQQSMSELSRDAHASTGYNGSGELNTCGASADTNSFSLISSYNSNVCKNQLIINSPVYAKKLTLRRNYGAQYSSSVGDNGYIQRGEIFNMRPDIYYWTYYQAQRNSILTTVFSRELPVRY